MKVANDSSCPGLVGYKKESVYPIKIGLNKTSEYKGESAYWNPFWLGFFSDGKNVPSWYNTFAGYVGK